MRISFRSLLSRRRVVQFVFVVTALVTLVALAVAVENYRTRRAWLEYRAEAQKRGVKLDLEQWLPQPLADEENLALTPLFRELDAKGKEAWKNFLNPPVDVGQPDDASNGKATDLKPWRYVMLDQKIIDTATEDPAADVLRGLERTVGRDMDRLAATLASRAFRIPLSWEDGFLSSTWTSTYWTFQMRAARLYHLRFTARVIKGEGGAAEQDLLAILRLGQTFEGQPTLLYAMARTALASLAVSGVQRGLAAEIWTEPQLRELENAMSGLDLLRVYQQGQASERAMGNHLVEQLVRGPLEYQQRLWNSNGVNSVSLGTRLQSYGEALIPECWFRWNQLMENHWSDAVDLRIDPAAGRIYSDQGRAEALLEYAQRNGINHVRFLLFNSAVYKRGGNAERTVADVHTGLCQARLAIALERFRLANGGYPQALDQLFPSYLPKLPVDVYTGELFYYRLTEDGRFVLADSKSAPRIRSATNIAQAAPAVRKEVGGIWHYVPTPPRR